MNCSKDETVRQVVQSYICIYTVYLHPQIGVVILRQKNIKGFFHDLFEQLNREEIKVETNQCKLNFIQGTGTRANVLVTT